MSRITQLQSNFSIGELDPLLRSRVDLQQYYNGLEKAQNIVVQPQGGMTRRPGLRFITELPSAAAPQNGTKLVPFRYSSEQSYMFAFANNRMYVFKDQALVTGINGGSDNFLVTSIGSANLATLYYTQNASILILVQEDMAPKVIERGTNHVTWTISDIAFDSIPKARFSASSYNPQGNLNPSGTDGNITLTHGFSTETGTAQAGAATAITLASGENSNNDFYNGLFIEITSGTGNGQVNFIKDYVGSTKVATVQNTWATNPASDSAYSISGFKSLAVGQYFQDATNFGRARVVKVNSNTEAEATVEIPFFDNNALSQGDWSLDAYYEPAWSTTRGWPRSCTFHEGRLYMGGSKSLVHTLWGSKVAIFYEFFPTENLAAQLDTDQVNPIVALRSGRDLQIFTDSAEFFVPQADLDPITPTNIVVKSASKRGMKHGIRPAAAESGTLFIQKSGRALREFNFSDTELSYVATNISLLSSHLIINPQDMTLRPSSSTDQGDLLLIVNGTATADTRGISAELQGSIAAYTLLRGQNVVAPARWITDGTFLNAAVDVDDIYVIVKRTLSSGAKYYVEAFDEDRTTDSSIQYYSGASSPDVAIPTNTTAGSLAHLEGKVLDVVADDIVEADKTVSSGNITLDSVPSTYVEAGLPYSIEVITMPFETKLPSGNVQGQRRRIIEATPFLYQSQNLAINGWELPFRKFPVTLGSGPVTFTGEKRITPILGYSRTSQLTITQTQPLFFTLLGIEYKVSVGQ